MVQNSTISNSKAESLSQMLFPEKGKNFNGNPIYAVFTNDDDYDPIKTRPNCKWNPLLDILAERLNATLIFREVPQSKASSEESGENEIFWIQKLIKEKRLDFAPKFWLGTNVKSHLESYHYDSWCFVAPLPNSYSITELILFLPMDKFCWMWLGVTISITAIILKIFDGHWNFFFGAFSHFMAQAQLIQRVQT